MEEFEEDNPMVELVNPIKLSDLRGKGIEFETSEIDLEEPEKAYFKPEDVLKNSIVPDYDSGDEDNDDDDDETPPFERMIKRMEDITPDKDGGVWKKILQQGSGDAVPAEAIVRIHYNAFLEYADEPYDSTRLRNFPQKAKLGSGQLLPGLDMAVGTMKKGELSRVIIRPKYGLGEMGAPPRVPKNATLLFVVELLSFVEHAGVDDYNFLTEEERRNIDFSQVMTVYKANKQEGKHFYDNKQYHKAFQHYRKAAKLLEECQLKDGTEEREQQESLLKVYLNMAVCCSKLCQSPRCITWCKKAMEIDSKNTRALFLYGKALHNMSEFDRAKDMLLRAKRMNPNNMDINDELKKLERDMNKFNLMEKDMCRKMFSNPKGQTEEERKRENKVIEAAEEKSLYCSDNFRKMIRERMSEFKNDPNEQEMPFPFSNLTVGEIDCVLENALEFGLTAKQFGTGSHVRFKILKKKSS